MKTALLLGLMSFNTEHQIRLCDDNKAVLQKLQLNNVQEKNSDVYYFETAGRDLSALGVSVRLRLKQNKAEITVKKRLGNSKIQTSSEGQMICENDLHGGVKELSCKINSTVDKNEFNKVLSKKKNWLAILSKEQLDFIRKYKADRDDVLIYGTLSDKRYQWTDKVLGEVTVDLVSLEDKEEIKFNEISIRYDDNDAEMGKRFEQFFKNTGVKACDDQLDWPVNKFDIMQIQQIQN